MEIGSEFWLTQDSERLEMSPVLPEWLDASADLKFLLSGRTAFDYILSDIELQTGIRRAYVPAYCCESMLQPLLLRGIELCFYDVSYDEKLGISYHVNADEECDIFLIMHYFGFVRYPFEELLHFREKGTIVIEDLTHSLFSHHTLRSICEYSFASLRKWFALPSGAVAQKYEGTFSLPIYEASDYPALRKRAMLLKGKYMNGESASKEDFLKLFNQSDHVLRSEFRNYGMDTDSCKLLSTESISSLIERRKENADFLYKELHDISIIEMLIKEITRDDSPLFVPVIVKGGLRDKLRTCLISHEIYCPVHWPLCDYIPSNSVARFIYQHELSLICDQRYTRGMLKRMVDVIRNFAREYKL